MSPPVPPSGGGGTADRRGVGRMEDVNRMTGRAVFSVSVRRTALDALILAVHTTAEGCNGSAAHRWHYGNVVGIGKPRLRDLDLSVARTRHGVQRPVAAVTVVTHHRISVDVVFAVTEADASAHFLCATTASPLLADQEASWAEYLAVGTSALLSTADVGVRLSGQCATGYE